jgi:glyoxylase-like metal-dependent hydrolase (beta-lactamase superfamily II)
MSDIAFVRDFEPRHGEAVTVAPGVRRVTAPNPGPFTFHGTNSYIVGKGRVGLIDPGPDDPAHLAALIKALKGETLTHIFVTHTHRDHSGGVAALKAWTGAATVAAGPHRFARPLNIGEVNPLDAAADMDFGPDIVLRDGGKIAGDNWQLEAVTTPGHTGNHLAFGLGGGDLLFSGDHVMAWSTTVVAPPDGAMADYMVSLDKLLGRPETRYLPGHGGPVNDAAAFVRALRSHRKMREAAILERLARGDETVDAMVKAVYRDTDPRLHSAAALSVLAHLEDLVARGKVASDRPPALDGRFQIRRPA